MNALDVIAREWGWVHREPNPQKLPDRSRKDLAKLFHKLGFKTGAEVGVERGQFSKQLCVYNPGLKLYAVDPWHSYGLFEKQSPQAQMEKFYEEACRRLAPYDATVMRMWSVEAAATIPDGSLDFVYLDAGHLLEQVIDDLTAWSPKVRSGGIMAGHDYTPRRPCYVVDAVKDWTTRFRIDPWFVLDGSRGVASCMWVKA